MKDRKTVLLACILCLLIAGFLILTARTFFLKDEPDDLPMEEDELLAFLDEQQLRWHEEEPQTLFWTTSPDPAE